MLKWMVTLFIVLAILSLATPWLGRAGLGRLPGDLRVPLRGRVYYVPFATTLVLSLLVWLLGRFI
jgi:hypothetical protein